MIDSAKRYFKENFEAIISFLLCVDVFLYFLGITNKLPFLGTNPIFTQRYFCLFLILAYLVLLWFFCKIKDFDKSTFIKVFFECSVVGVVSMLYFTTINRQIIFISQFNQRWLIFDTGIIMVPMMLLIFLTVYFTFLQKRTKNWLLTAQVFLILVFTTSTVELLQSDKTNIRKFEIPLIDKLTEVNNAIWLILGFTIIAALSTIKAQNLQFISKTNFFLLSLFALIQVGVLSGIKEYSLITINGFNFWYSSILILVFWNLFYFQIIKLFTKVNKELFLPKLVISTIYHFVLIIITVIFALS